MSRYLLACVAVLSVIASGCAAAVEEPVSGVHGSDATLPATPTVATEPPAASFHVESVPDEVVEALIADAMSRSGASDTDSVVLESSSDIGAPDLGPECGPPGEDPLDGSGHQVVLRVGGDSFDYRVDPTGSAVLCDDAGPIRIDLSGPTGTSLPSPPTTMGSTDQ